MASLPASDPVMISDGGVNDGHLNQHQPTPRGGCSGPQTWGTGTGGSSDDYGSGMPRAELLLHCDTMTACAQRERTDERRVTTDNGGTMGVAPLLGAGAMPSESS